VTIQNQPANPPASVPLEHRLYGVHVKLDGGEERSLCRPSEVLGQIPLEPVIRTSRNGHKEPLPEGDHIDKAAN